MSKRTLANPLRSSIFWLTLLVWISFSVAASVPAQSDSGGGKINKAAMVTRHMQMMRQRVTVQGRQTGLEARTITDQEVTQVEEALRNGTMRPKEACSHCHVPGQKAP